MSDKYKDIAARALAKKSGENNLNESRMTYEDSHAERLNPRLAKQLRDRAHSLGTHPIFPESDESHFEEKLMSKRFADVLKTFKRHHGTEVADLQSFYQEQGQMLMGTVQIEKRHKEELEQLAINLVRDEYDIDESEVEIIANLTTDFSQLEINKNPPKLTPDADGDSKFDSHAELVKANGEVYKRRFINAMIQGSAKKVNHMFHMVDTELQDMDPQLPHNYSKIMSGADYAYMMEDGNTPKIAGGGVSVEFPKGEGDIPKITAEAMTFPVLIHELVKGVMEILSAHGLPKEPGVAKYAMGKADFMNAETWDMRLGPPIWEKFLESIPPEHFALKHHVYIELVALPVDEFNEVMREIMLGTRSGKAKVQEIIDEVIDELKSDEFDDAMSHISDDDFFTPEDLDNIDDEDWF